MLRLIPKRRRGRLHESAAVLSSPHGPPMFVLAVATAVFVLAGLVKGVIGLGLPTIAVGLLSLFVTPAQAAAWMLVPSLLTNIWQVAAGPNLWPLTRRLATLLAGIALGTWLGSGIITGASAGHASMALGVVLMIYAGLGLSPFRPRVPARAEPWLSPLVGLATDYCVAYSALDAARLGFTATVLEGAARAIDLNGSLAEARDKMRAAGVALEA